MPVSRSYFAYEYSRGESGVTVRFTGSGEKVDFEIPMRAVPELRRATIDGVAVEAVRAERDGGIYLCVSAEVAGVRTLDCR